MLVEEYDMITFLEQIPQRTVSMIGAAGYIADFIGWNDRQATVYTVDLFSGAILSQKNFGAHDIFLGVYRSDDKAYYVFSDQLAMGTMQLSVAGSDGETTSTDDPAGILSRCTGQKDVCINEDMGILWFDGSCVRRCFENRKTFSADFPENEKERIATELICPAVSYLGEGIEALYYLETSGYARMPYEQTDGIVWAMNKTTGSCEKLDAFTTHYWRIFGDDSAIEIETDTQSIRFDLK